MSTSGKYKTPRREKRFPVRVPVVLRMGGKDIELYSGDVSFRGLFICTDNPPVLRQLITIEIRLPPDDTPFKSHGMSVYVLKPGEEPGRLPGVGVQFYAQSDAERRKWERFVTHIRQNKPELPPDAIDPVKRMHPRIGARFEVHPRDLEELKVLYTRDISTGGMFLETDMQLELGRPLTLTIFHPVTRRSFTIDSVVKRRNAHKPPGLGVEFTNLDRARLTEFQGFVEDGLAALNELDEAE